MKHAPSEVVSAPAGGRGKSARDRIRRGGFGTLGAGLVIVLRTTVLSAQPAPPALPGQAPGATPPAALTLEGSVQYATDHFPAIKQAMERVNAAAAEVGAARAAYLPRLDAVWQSTRGTANNVFGQMLPQSVIPALTGPVLPDVTGAGAWGSAAGALLSWEPVDLGLRRATVDAAASVTTRRRAEQSITRLDVQAAVARAFLGVVAAERNLRAARADLDRRTVLAGIVRSLVDNQLRPGADASRADAERAGAAIRVARSEQALAVAQSELRRDLGGAGGPLVLSSERLLAQVPPADVPPVPADQHPLALAERASVDQARSDERVLARTNLPRVVLQSSVFGRGTGANPDGTLSGGSAGLAPQRGNWLVGVQVVVPNLFGFAALGARKAAAAATERADAAAYDQTLLDIAGEQEATAAVVRSAREIAALAPVQLGAAREAESRARARYSAGLASMTEVADAQALLAQAEAQDELARVDVWQALLAAAVARGDLAPFLALSRDR